ncbi:MAG: Sec-independent protein translocase subunit TatA/TatB [Candidatus Thorarchaeota archaeon]|jgi:sec-independent protein translocase protein TatA
MIVAFTFGMPGPMELIIIGFIGLLLFGKRLPSTMRSLGSSIVEFKKGLSDVKDDLEEIEKEVKS